jgi:hypothetical protein
MRPALAVKSGSRGKIQVRCCEIYFSIVQRKALTPNDFSSLAEVEDRLLGFQHYYESIATPFEWKFTRDDLAELLKKLDTTPTSLKRAA